MRAQSWSQDLPTLNCNNTKMNESRIGKLPANVFLWLDTNHPTNTKNINISSSDVILNFRLKKVVGVQGARVEMCGTFDLCPDCPV